MGVREDMALTIFIKKLAMSLMLRRDGGWS